MDEDSSDKLEAPCVVQSEEADGGSVSGCDLCGGDHDTEQCPELAMEDLEQVLKASTLTRARLTIPFFLGVEESPNGTIKVIAKNTIATRTRLGPFEAPRTTQAFENDSDIFSLKVFLKDGSSVVLDTSNENQCNWLCLVRAATQEANLVAVQLGMEIFYVAKQQIEPEQELTVWYAPHYARKLGKDPRPDGITQAAIHYKLQTAFNDLMIGTNLQEIPAEKLAQVTLVEMGAAAEAAYSEEPVLDAQGTVEDPPAPSHSVVCEVCGMDFPSEGILSAHATVHAQAGSEEEAICSRQQDAGNLTPEANEMSTSPLLSVESLAVQLPSGGQEYCCRRCDAPPLGSLKDLALHIQQHIKAEMMSHGLPPRLGCPGRSVSSRLLKEEDHKSVSCPAEDSNDLKSSITVTVLRQLLDEGSAYGIENKRTLDQTGVVQDKVNLIDLGSSKKKHSLDSDELKVQAKAAVEQLRAASRKVAIARRKNTEKTEPSLITCTSSNEKAASETEEYNQRNEKAKNLETSHKIDKLHYENTTANKNKKNAEDEKCTISNYTKEELAKMNPKVILRRYELPTGCHRVKIDAGSSRKQDFYYPLKFTKRTPYVPKETIIRTRRQASHEQRMSGSPVQRKQKFVKMNPILETSSKKCRLQEDLFRKENVSEKQNATVGKISKLSNRKKHKDEKTISPRVEPSDAPTSDLSGTDLGDMHGLTDCDETLEESKEPVRMTDVQFLSQEINYTIMDSDENTGKSVVNFVLQDEASGQREAGLGNKIQAYICEKCEEKFDSEDGLNDHLIAHSSCQQTALTSADAEQLNSEVTSAVLACLSGDENLQQAYLSTEDLGEDVTVIQFITDTHADTTEANGEIEEGEVNLQLLLPDNKDEKVFQVPHSCEDCGKVFKTEVHLKRHMKGHLVDLQCPKCLKKFARTESLTKHKCTTDKESLWPCEFCSQSFTEKKYLYRHMATHTGEFVCPKCRREFARKESLLLHQRTCDPEALKTAGMYPCTLCKKVFVRELSLQNHMALHTEEFKCEHCNQCFASKFSSYRHVCGSSVKREEPEGIEVLKPYKCLECSRSFSTEEYLTRHMKIHSGQLCCTMCKKSCSSKEDLVKHMLECSARAQEVSNDLIKCPVCAAELANAEEFRTHYQDHTHPYKCELCQCSFLRKGSYDGHICEPLEGGHFKCNRCPKSFFNKNSLLRHQLVHGKPKHQCSKCKRKFAEEEHLLQHVCPDRSHNLKRTPKQLHNFPKGPEAVICPTCGKSYSTPGNLNKHMLTHEEKTEECNLCHKLFHHKAYLNEHMLSHVNERPYKCDYCGKTFKGRNSVRSHVQQFHGNTLVLYECETCGRQFRQKGNLKKHMLKHSDKRTYQCRLCQRNFKYPEQLRRHTLWHDEQHRHQCHLCDRKFVMKFELKQHLDMHKGTVFICEFCNTECTTPTSMRRHLKRRHPLVGRWQENTNDYIKTLMYQSNVNYTFKPLTDREAEEAGFKNVDQLLHQDIEHPLIVAEVSSIDEEGQDQNTQTILIQADPDQFQGSETMVSEDVAKALQALQQQGLEHGHTNFTIIDSVATQGSDKESEGENKGQNINYYIVPLPDGTTVTVTDPSQLAATMAGHPSGEVHEIGEEQREEDDMPLPVASFPQLTAIHPNIVTLADHQSVQLTKEQIVMETNPQTGEESPETIDEEAMTMETQTVAMNSLACGVTMGMVEGSLEAQEGIAMHIVSEGVDMESAYHQQELESIVIEDSKDIIAHLQDGASANEPTYITYAIMPDTGQMADTEVDGQTYITQEETVEENMPISVASEETVAMETVVYL